MATPQVSAIIQHLRRVALSHDGTGMTDGQLLESFIAGKDEAAFEVLLRRHGPMVLGVCYRILRNHHDSEDAFQATFLVFARKASSVRPRERVANWLHGVALRTALNARAMKTKKQARERQVSQMPEPEAAEPDRWNDLQPVLDEELAKLPEAYRLPLLLCDVEGKSIKEATQQLGWPQGTLAGRLARARKMLATRLTQRGVALSAGSLAMVLSAKAAPACVTPALVVSTVKAAVTFAAGKTVATGAISANVAALTEGVVRTMLLTKLKIATAVLVVVAVVGAAVGTLLGPVLAQTPVEPKAQKQPATDKSVGEKKPQAAGPGALLLIRADSVAALTPEGKNVAEFSVPRRETPLSGAGRLSPDGARIAFLVVNEGLRPPARVGEDENAKPWPVQVVVRKLGADKPLVKIDVPCEQLCVCWSPDGKKLVAAKMIGRGDNVAFENVLIDVDTGKSEPVALPAGTRVLDWSRNGKTFLVQEYDRKAKKNRLALAARGEEALIPLCDLRRRPLDYVPDARLSPDGKQVLFIDADPENDKDAHRWGVSARPYVLDIASKKRMPLADFPLSARALGVAWSPDGTRVAYIWKQNHLDLLKKDDTSVNAAKLETEAFLIVADTDGKNAKVVSSAKCDNAVNPILLSIDWR